MTVVLPSVDEELIENLLRASQDKNLIKVAEKVLNGRRLSEEEALNLFQSKEIPLIGLLAEYQNRKKIKITPILWLMFK